MDEDLYAVLLLEGGGPHVPQVAIRKAYRARALVLHPDKRGDDPAAAAEFQKVQKAYDVLSDEKGRAAYDELLRVRKERVEKESKQSEKRRKMMNDLVERERAHERDQKAKAEEDRAAIRLKTEIARIRKIHAQHRGKESLFSDFGNFAKATPIPVPGSDASDMDKTIKASWTCLEGGGGGYSAARLREIFGEFGQVEDIVIRQKSKKKASALIVMGSKEAAIAATRRQCGDLSNPLLVLPTLPSGGAGLVNMEQPTSKVTTAPVKLGNSLVGAGYSSYQDVTLHKMRQAAERARLEKDIREEDAKSS